MRTLITSISQRDKQSKSSGKLGLNYITDILNHSLGLQNDRLLTSASKTDLHVVLSNDVSKPSHIIRVNCQSPE